LKSSPKTLNRLCCSSHLQVFCVTCEFWGLTRSKRESTNGISLVVVFLLPVYVESTYALHRIDVGAWEKTVFCRIVEVPNGAVKAPVCAVERGEGTPTG
jgi:hypothetical protein